jgi:hypothetical protein
MKISVNVSIMIVRYVVLLYQVLGFAGMVGAGYIPIDVSAKNKRTALE